MVFPSLAFGNQFFPLAWREAVGGRFAPFAVKPLPNPKTTAARASAALRELAASEALACNLATGLRADALVIDELLARANPIERQLRDKGFAGGAHEGARTAALATAVDATDRAIGLGQAIENWSTLSRRWAALISPALRDPAALATVGALATLDLVEDFISQSNQLFALAAEASESCRESVELLRQAGFGAR